MKKLLQYLILLLVPVFSAVSGYSQTFEWEKLLGNTEIEFNNSAIKLSNGNRYILGAYVNRNVQVGDLPLIMITDTSGNLIQRKTYPNFFSGRIYDLSSNGDNTFMALGDGSDSARQQAYFFLFKADSVGNIIWQKQYPTTRLGNTMKVLTVPDGYLFFASGFNDIYKTDKQGNLMWQKAYFQIGSQTDISLLKDGSYIVSGYTTQGSNPSIPSYYQVNPLIMQLRPNGDTIRTKVLGSVVDHDLVNTARQTSDGGLILAGRYTNNSNPTRMEGMVIKLDSAWNQEWWHTFYPKTGTYNDGSELYNVQETIDSSFIVSGYYRDDVPHPWGDAAGFVAKLSRTGAELWTRQYQVNGIGEWFYDMVYNDDGSAIFSGNKRISSNNEDFYLVKLSNLGLPYKPDYCSTLPTADFTASLLANDTVQFSDLSAAGTQYGTISTWEWHLGDGTVSTDSVPKHKYSQTLQQLHNTPVTIFVTNNSGCRDSITLYPFRTLSVSKQLPNVQVSLYPNPATEQATITLSGYNQEVELQVLDVTGRKVTVPVQQSLQGESQQLQLNTAALPKGLYLYRLVHKGELVATGKLVKE